MKISKCCKAKVKIEGTPDFIGDTQACTCYHVCLKCGSVCDIIEKTYKSVKELTETLKAKRKWYDYPQLWFYWYFWNYVSEIPLKVKSFIQRGIRGWSDRDVWNFDYYLARVIKEGCEHLNHEGIHKWHTDKEFQKIINTFKIALEIIDSYELSPKQYKKKIKQFEKDGQLFIKNFFRLWD